MNECQWDGFLGVGRHERTREQTGLARHLGLMAPVSSIV